ncbi:MAG: TRAP-type C4-dicarboxylate transporter, periplasmic solute-binding protein [Bacteroidetes bacterium]|jgi:DNA-binding NarL/FixJ family response regulator|nr:TRAP-type C4-dicarboxylate transporter, periplasmic solute-binding protein [Bacteroidota bacterium]
MDSARNNSAGKTIKLLIADDHTIVRRALISLLSLNERMEVVGEAADGRVAVELADRLEPDVVLMDISMPALNGLEATRQIRKQSPSVKILILTAHDNEEYVLEVVRSGANGYILKNCAAEDLYNAIVSIHSGHAFFSPSVSKILADDYVRSINPDGSGGSPLKTDPRLTAREREILQLVAEGETHQRIAETLHISVRTVDTHCNNIMKKLDIHDTASLVTYAIKNGILILPR